MKRDRNKTKDKNATGGDPEYVLVYSTDPQAPAPVRQDKKPEIHFPLRPAIRIEKKGRGGKSVTVAFKLPPDESMLEQLCKYLKRSIGTGGTFYLGADQGVIEIQGEREKQVRELIEAYR